MKKLFSILVVVFFVGSILAQQGPKKQEPNKTGEKAKTECCKSKESKTDAKACCDKAKTECKSTKTECKDAKKDSTKCTGTKKAS